MKFLIPFILGFATTIASAQPLYFPPLSGSSWETLTPGSLGWDDSRIPALVDYLRTTHTKAFIVLKDGCIVIEEYFDDFSRDSLWYWASAGKSLTAALVGIAKQEGFLSLDDATSKFLGEGWTSLPPEKERLITVRHQLSMTTGLDDGTGDADCTLPSCLVYKSDPGSRWAYHSAPYTVLDGVIEGGTNISLNLWYLTRLRSKIGMDGGYLPSGTYNKVLFTTPRSMARFGLLMLNRGTWAGTAVIKDSAFLHQMITPSQAMNPSYGYLWWLNGYSTHMLPQTQRVFQGALCPEAPSDMILAAGKNGQLLNVVPGQRLIVVRMGDDPNETGLISSVLNNEIWKRLNPVIRRTTGVPCLTDLPPLEFSLSPNPASRLVNVHWNQSSPAEVRISMHDLLGRKLMERSAWVDTGTQVWSFHLVPTSRTQALFMRIESGNHVSVRPFLSLP